MAGGMLEPLGRKNIQKLIDGLQKALTMPKPTPRSCRRKRRNRPAPAEAPATQPPSRSDMPHRWKRRQFSPVNAEPPEKGTSTPAQETSHGDHNA